MKKILSFLFAFSFLFILSSSVYANPPSGKTVKGKIKTSSNANANGATVNVTCGSNTLNTTTASNGNWEVLFPTGQCNDGDTVTVNASFNGETGSDTKTAGPGSTLSFNVIKLAAVSVPELGFLQSVIASLTSGGAFLLLKKRII